VRDALAASAGLPSALGARLKTLPGIDDISTGDISVGEVTTWVGEPPPLPPTRAPMLAPPPPANASSRREVGNYSDEQTGEEGQTASGASNHTGVKNNETSVQDANFTAPKPPSLEPLEEPAEPSGLPAPRLLKVVSPNGQSDCAGEYTLVSGDLVNGQPLWKLGSGERWIFNSEGHWAIGGEEEQAEGFAGPGGLIAQIRPHGGAMPEKANGTWKRWDGDEFREDPAITVTVPTTAPLVLEVVSPSAPQVCVGYYKRLADQTANGQPIWKQVAGSNWIYSSTEGRWSIGTGNPNFAGAGSRDFIIAGRAHHGLMPVDAELGGWQKWNGKVFQDDPTIVVRVGFADLDSIVDNFIANLDGAAERMVKAKTAELAKGARIIPIQTRRELEAASNEGLREQLDALEGGPGHQVASETSARALGEVRKALLSAEATVQAHARALAQKAGHVYFSQAERDVEGLARWSGLLAREARTLASEAVQAQNTSIEAGNTTSQSEPSWPRAEVNSTLRVAEVAESLAPELKREAENVTKIARIAHQLAMQTLDEVTEVSRHAANASALAMEAVEQATQNSLKLKSIKALVEKVASVAAAQESGVAETALNNDVASDE